MDQKLTQAEVAARLIVGLADPWPTAKEVAWLRKWQPAGVILFSRNVTNASQLHGLCRLLHEILPAGEIVADHEGGPVSQLAVAVGRPPAAWTLGQLARPEWTQAVHEETGRRLLHLGIDRVLAPCCDVLSERRNPVIGVRAFGHETIAVGQQVEAAVKGLLKSGISSCLKHWPGHGASRQDSHLGAADGHVAEGAGDWTAPFGRGLVAGADAVMVGHLDQNGEDLPATLNGELMARWRDQFVMEAAGPVLVYCDDVTMGALRPAMARLGIVPADDQEPGMVEPDAIPLAWLEQLVLAGSDRLLIRGVPTLALPEPKGVAPALDLPDPETLPSFDEAIYDQVWQRLIGKIMERQPGFVDIGLELGWLDLTLHDRWEVANEENSEARGIFGRHLERAFGKVVFLDCVAKDEIILNSPRLLITSHRPLPLEVLSSRFDWTSLPTQGAALVAGHPSIAPDLAKFLPAGWLVTACHEINWDKLIEIL